MSIELKSGATTDLATVDPTSKAIRVTQYTPAGEVVSTESKATYFAAGTFTPAATPTDLVTIFGSATKTIRVVRLYIATTNTAAGSQTFFVTKRTAANTAGTHVAATVGRADENDAASTATTVGHYTANPSGLGAGINIGVKRVASPVLVPATFAGVVQDAGYDLLDFTLNSETDKFVTLRGVVQGLVINFAGAALVAGQVHAYQIVWTEE